MTAQIVIDDSVNPAASGSTDLAVTFLGNTFTFTNFDNTGVLGWQWTLVDKPTGSSAALVGATTNTATLVPDVEGTYYVRLQTYTDAGRTTLDAQDDQLVGIRFAAPRDWLIPSAQQTTQLGGSRGWAEQVNEILRDMQSALTGFDMQDAYDADPAIVLTAATPLPLTTSGVGQDGITVTDGAGTVRIQGACIITPCLQSNNAAPAVDTAGTDLGVAGQAGGAASASGGGAGADLNFTAGVGGVGSGSFASGPGGSVNISANNAGAFAGAGGNVGGDINFTAGLGDQQADGVITFTVGGVTTTWTQSGTTAPSGTYAAPSYSFSGDSGSGLLLDSVGAVALATDGAPRLLVDGLVNAASGNEINFALTPTVNKIAGNYTALDIDVTETLAGGTKNKLISAGVGGAPLFTVLSDGGVESLGALASKDGTVGAPGLTFVTQNNMGFSAPNTDEMQLSTGGVVLSVMKQGLVHASANEVSYSITPTVNKVAGDYTALLVNATETAAPGTANKLIDAQVGGSSVFSVTDAGQVVCSSVASGSTTGSYFYGNVTLTNNADLLVEGRIQWFHGWQAAAGPSQTVNPNLMHGERLSLSHATTYTLTYDTTSSGGFHSGSYQQIWQTGVGNILFATGTATVRVPPGKSPRSKGRYSTFTSQYPSNTEVYLTGDLARKVRTEGGVFTVNGDDYDAIIEATTTTPSTNVTVDAGVEGQVVTILLTGTAGTLEFIAGTAAIEVEEGKTVTSNAPGASTFVSISIIYTADAVAKITGNLA